MRRFCRWYSQPFRDLRREWAITREWWAERKARLNQRQAAEGGPFWCYWCAIADDCSRCNGIAWRPDIPCEHPHP